MQTNGRGYSIYGNYDSMKKLIVIANDADACGKTTLTALLSGFIQRKGMRHVVALTSEEQELPLETVLLNAEDGFAPEVGQAVHVGWPASAGQIFNE